MNARAAFRISACGFFCLIEILCLGSAKAQVSIGIDVTATIRDTTATPEIVFSLRNTSNQSVEIPRKVLPWVQQTSVVLVAVALDQPQDPLINYHAFQYPPSDSVVVLPGETISGSVSLRGQFRGVEELLLKTPVLVFWSYQLRTPDGAESKRFGGQLVVSKSGRNT